MAARYATALYALASEQKNLSTVEADIASLNNALHMSQDLQAALHNPRLGRVALQKILAALADQMQLNTATKNFLGVVAMNGRAALLPAFAKMFLEMAASKRGEQVAEVTSAQPLTDEQRNALMANLETAGGQKVTLQLKQDPALLGGLKIKLGSKLYDGSLQGQLARLLRSLKEAA